MKMPLDEFLRGDPACLVLESTNPAVVDEVTDILREQYGETTATRVGPRLLVFFTPAVAKFRKRVYRTPDGKKHRATILTGDACRSYLSRPSVLAALEGRLQ